MKTHRIRRLVNSKPGIRIHPREFVFVDRKTGKKRFAVKPGRDGSLPVEQTSSLLAMHCVLRSQTPADFRVMVAVGGNFMGRIVPRAKKLIDTCSPALMPIRITTRQQQVLRGIFQNLRNKEIAASIGVAERTVKFHVAALLQKFHVETRVGLTEKVSDLISAEGIPGNVFPAESAARAFHAPGPTPANLQPTLVRVAAGASRAGR